MYIENVRIHQITGRVVVSVTFSVSFRVNIAVFWNVTTFWLVICYQLKTELSASTFRVEISNILPEQVVRLTLKAEALGSSANSFTL
jgi:hypothetical protein